MKKLTTLCSAILLIASVFLPQQASAQTPGMMSYQAVVRDGNDALVATKTVGMQISILQSTSTGTAVYTETQTPTTNANGLVSLEIGTGTTSDDFSTIDWSAGPYFIKTETDPSGGANYTITGTSELLSVPYALHAKTAKTAKTAESLVGGDSGVGGFTHYIGEEFGGGVVFHLWKDAQGVEHGLIVDKTDLSKTQAWSNIDQTLIGPSAQSSWDGLSNSNAIEGQAGHSNSASALCLNSTNGGKSDWYLPSIDELSLLWHSRFNVNKSLSAIGGATVLPTSAYYWSSTEFNATFAFNFGFNYGSSNFGNKSNTYSVRAVRAF